MIKLFYNLGSCSLASHIALEEAGADDQAMRISMADGDQKKPESMAINPKGRIPAGFPKVHATRERLRARPAFGKVLAEAAA